MKKSVIAAVAVLVAVAVLIVACVPSASSSAEFLRIHIRAESNSASDQNVKYVVKQAVVNFLTPYLCAATTKAAAMQAVRLHLAEIKAVCDKALVSQGKTYVSAVRLCEEAFPDRSYNGVTLSAGVYDALIIELGSGNGNNWWCVVYPPLCFVGETDGTQNIVYKSKLLQIIQNWKNSRK